MVVCEVEDFLGPEGIRGVIYASISAELFRDIELCLCACCCDYACSYGCVWLV